MLVADLAGRVKREIVLARFIGKMAVDQGVREARSHLSEVMNALQPVTGPAAGQPMPADFSTISDDSVPAEGAADTAAPDVDVVEVVEEERRPDVGELALDDYDQLPSAHIVAMLEGLEAEERDAIEVYERTGRHRRTILGKLALLRAESS